MRSPLSSSTSWGPSAYSEPVLRPLELDDVPALARLVRANRTFLANSGPLRQEDYFTDEGQETAVRMSLQNAQAGASFPMVIVDDADELIGTLNLNSIIRGAFQSASIGYWVAQDRNGQGVATAAVAEAKDVAFGQLGLHRIQAETRPENHASQRVLLKNGFAQYGIAPNYLKIAGRWQTHVLFQLVAPDPDNES